MRRAILRSSEIDALSKLILVELAEQTERLGDVIPLQVANVCALCVVCDRTGRKALLRTEELGIIQLERLSGLVSRARWNLEHPLVAGALRSAVRTSVRARVPQHEAAAPLDAGDVELLELLGRAVARERARRLGVPVLATSLLPPSAEGRVIVRWMREHGAALGVAVDELAARVAAAYVANDGNNGALRACGWRLVWLPRELDRISARLAKKCAPAAADDSASAPLPPDPPERLRAQQLGQFAEMAKRAIAGGAS